MPKGTKLVVMISVLLTIMVAILAYLNRDYTLVRNEAQENGVFFFRAGQEEFTVSMEDLVALSPVSIAANYKTSGQPAETRIYQGVSLKTLTESLGLDCSSFSSAVFLAADGYASALTIDEALDSSNCFIAIAGDSKPLGSKEEGGFGPFMMIMPQDKYSQRWCKYLLEVTLQ